LLTIFINFFLYHAFHIFNAAFLVAIANKTFLLNLLYLNAFCIFTILAKSYAEYSEANLTALAFLITLINFFLYQTLHIFSAAFLVAITNNTFLLNLLYLNAFCIFTILAKSFWEYSEAILTYLAYLITLINFFLYHAFHIFNAAFLVAIANRTFLLNLLYLNAFCIFTILAKSCAEYSEANLTCLAF